MNEKLEYRSICDEPTGRAGAGEDSLYTDNFGPVCETCFSVVEKCGVDDHIKKSERLETELKSLRSFIRTAAESDNCYDILYKYLGDHP